MAATVGYQGRSRGVPALPLLLLPLLLGAAPPAAPSPIFSWGAGVVHPTELVALSRDGRLMAHVVGEGPSLLEVWDVRASKRLLAHKLPGRGLSGSGVLQFTSDGKSVVVGFVADGDDVSKETVRVVGVATGRAGKDFKMAELHGHRGVLLPDDRTLLGTTAEGVPVRYDLRTGKCLGEFSVPAGDKTVFGYPSLTTALALSPDGGLLATSVRCPVTRSRYKAVLALWSVGARKLLWRQEEKVPHECLSFSPDGKLLASAQRSLRAGVVIRRVKDGDWLAEKAYEQRALAFLPNGWLLLDRRGRCGFLAWDHANATEPCLQTWAPPSVYGRKRDPIRPVELRPWANFALSADGKTLAFVTNQHGLLVFDLTHAWPSLPAPKVPAPRVPGVKGR